MPDITMCKGNGCKIKEDCYRFKARPSYWQSYFTKSPVLKKEDGNQSCLYYEKVNNIKV